MEKDHTQNPEVRRDALRKLGGIVDHLDLPARGMGGNSHMLMMDRNSDQIAALIQEWIADHALMR
jgi:hypothetical protein